MATRRRGKCSKRWRIKSASLLHNIKTSIRSIAAMSTNPRNRMSLPSLGLSLIVVAMGLSSTGCSMLGWNRDREVVRVLEDPTHPVSEIICLWSPAEGQDMKGLPCRGFAAQILFFAIGSEAPAEVGGEVMVYVFDDHGTVEEQKLPLHQFNFPNESWRTYLRNTNFGASYQLFIPYTRPTSEAAICNLRVRYTSPEGRITFSKIEEISLPGTPRQHARQTDASAGGGGQQDTQASLLEQLESPRQGAAEASQVSQASHTESALVDPRFSLERTPDSQLHVSTSQIELQSAQLVNNQMAALDRLVGSLEAGPVTSAGALPSSIVDLRSPPSTSNEVSPAHILAPVDAGDSEPESATPTTTQHTHRLHPLATELEAAP